MELDGDPEQNLPEACHLIVCPVNLRDQWMGELHRFVEYGVIGLLPYQGACTEGNRKVFWEQFYAMKVPMDRRVILATNQVRPCNAWKAYFTLSMRSP